jgi:hypothetical protein
VEVPILSRLFIDLPVQEDSEGCRLSFRYITLC